MQTDHRQFNFIYKRASYEVYKKFRINKLELWLLTSLEWFLINKNKTVISRDDFFENITGNSREKAKMRGYYQGLVTGKFIGCYEYISSPGSLSIGLSDLGHNVLRCYDQAIGVFMEKYPRSPYRLDEAEPSVVKQEMARYRKTA